MLRLYNTLTRSLEEFVPIAAPKVGLYACGPTVYRPPHVGNYRAFAFYDLLHRYLEWKGFEVHFVMNLTDVEDKIIESARQQQSKLDGVTAPMIEAFFTDLDSIAILPADHYPRATGHIDGMIALIQRLLDRGHAYTTPDGSVYFAIGSYADYGKLSRIELQDIRSGAGLATRDRVVDADEYTKEDARDFALWKAAKDVDREVGAVWQTPWGEGRPGWHIECSAMSMQELGETFDIHTGGEDLIFPHHEDEIAQSEAATGKPFVRYWLHVKHLLVNGEKMSKSKRNDFTLGQLFERGYSAAVVRYLLLSAHYRNELNFTFDGLDTAKSAVRRLQDFETRLSDTPVSDSAGGSPLSDIARKTVADFERALDDDLNTSAALATLFDFVRDTNAALDRHPAVTSAERSVARDTLAGIDRVFGILDLARKHSTDLDADLATWVEQKISERQSARGRRDFAAADSIRAELIAKGVIIEDTASGTRWKRA